MIDPKKLMRGVFFALAVSAVVPVFGVGGPVLGVATASAQTPALIASVLFEGNQRFSDAQLLTMVDTATRGTYTEAGVQTDVESIRMAYDQAGYTNVSVSARTEVVESGRVRVIFVVNEGERAGIAAINFTGNNAFGAGTLKSVINTKESGFLSWLLKDDTYDQQKVEVDKELIRLYYANHGYPDAQVTSAVAEFDPNRNAYFINFTIVEGEQYSFGNIGIETSIAGLDAEALRSAVRTDTGSRYSFADLQETTEEMALNATDQGYSFADVRPRIDRDVANRIFNVTYLVDEGARIYVERVNITGNEKTRDFVIRRELDFAEGDPFNRSIVSRGKTAIEALGFFERVDVSTEQGSAPDKVVININVVEQSTGDYGLTAGYSTQDGILGEVSITERNFLGRGQFVRAAIGASETGRSFDFSFTEPRFMGLNISSGIDIYHRINDESAGNFYGSTATGGQLRVGLPITRDLNASLFTGLEQRTFVDGSTFTNSDGDEETYDEDSAIVDDGDVANKYWAGYTLTYDALDDRKKPREGLFATFTQQYIGYDFQNEFSNYLKSEGRARYFLPVLQDTDIVASVRGQAGIIQNLDGDDVDATLAFNPGSSLVRGFKGRGYGPRLTSDEFLGSTAYAGISAELEFPIPVLPESYGLRGAVWADAGWVDGVPGFNGTDGADVPADVAVDEGSTDNNFKSSVGASIIWDSPFGPLRGDFAHVLSKASEDETQVFQLTLSTLL